MFRLHESEREYRFKDSGPKYLMKGPRMNFAVVQFQPGEDFEAHYHEFMEENFFVLEGELEIVVDDEIHLVKAGDFLHVEPGEVHYCINKSDKPMKMIACLAPYQESDKIVVENYVYPGER